MKHWLVATERGEYIPQNEYKFFETKEEAISFKDECFRNTLQKIRECSDYILDDYVELSMTSYIYYKYSNLFKSIKWRVIRIE